MSPQIYIDPMKQFIYVLLHPILFLLTLFRTYVLRMGGLVINSFIGPAWLAWWYISLPLWMVIATLSLIITSLISGDTSERRFDSKTRWLCTAIFMAGFLVINGIAYLAFTEVRNHFITGLQGRYFIPFTPLLIPLFSGRLVLKDYNRVASKFFPIGCSITLLSCVIIVLNRFI
jgi:uncharacterized membrane protein